MYILAGDSWEDAFLDYYRAPADYRIEVKFLMNLTEIEGLYPFYGHDWRLVFNYAKAFGIKAVLRKIRSRIKESLRNQVFLSWGLGYISEDDAQSPLKSGQAVLFIAPRHPRCVQRVVLPMELLQPCDESLINKLGVNNFILHMEATAPQINLDIFKKIIGWAPFSGTTLDKNILELGFEQLKHLLNNLDFSRAQKLPTPPTQICERIPRGHVEPEASKLQGVIFGYGHYAKTVIIPNVASHISIAAVHEIDPCQNGAANGLPFAVDTAPIPREDERYDVYFIAGYHHTHAPLAARALRQGSSVIMEKPPVTTWGQLDELLAAMESGKGRLYIGYTRRHLIFNQYIRTDLGLGENEPISYHCILQMSPLTPLHWYRWPNSGSQIICNGCHWIDHFLYLNNWPEITYYDSYEMANGDISCTAELENGSNFCMVLTTMGSTRLGYREIITLRSDQATVYIQDLATYQSEDSRRIIRKAKIKRPKVYDTMYQTLSRHLAMDQPGESPRSLRLSAGLMLHLEDRLRKKSLRGARPPMAKI